MHWSSKFLPALSQAGEGEDSIRHGTVGSKSTLFWPPTGDESWLDACKDHMGKHFAWH